MTCCLISVPVQCQAMAQAEALQAASRFSTSHFCVHMGECALRLCHEKYLRHKSGTTIRQ